MHDAKSEVEVGLWKFLDDYELEDTKIYNLGGCLSQIKLRGRPVGVCGDPRRENNSFLVIERELSYIKAHQWYFLQHRTGSHLICVYHKIDHHPIPGIYATTDYSYLSE